MTKTPANKQMVFYVYEYFFVQKVLTFLANIGLKPFFVRDCCAHGNR